MKKNLKPMIISALTAIAMGTVGVGTTFALFTDKAETSISVKAGIVEAKSDVKLISYENTGDLTNVAKAFTTETSYETEIGTSFSIDENGNFKIQKMVPGDKVVLSVGFKNLSNVDTKYRLNVRNDGGALVPALKVSMTGGNVFWKDLPAASDAEIAAGGKSVETAVVTIEFVNHDQGILEKDDQEALDNKYMNATATYSLAYELVQGNAATVDEVGVLDGYEEVASKPTDLEPGKAYQFEETIGGGVATFSGWSKDDSDVVLAVEKSENANFQFSGADATISYELTATNTDPNKDVTVSVFVGTGYVSVTTKHNGEDIASTYNAETGYVTFVTKTFSPFQFVCFEEQITYVTTADGLKDALEHDEDAKIYIGADFDCAEAMMVSRDTEIYGLGHTIRFTSDRGFRVNTSEVQFDLNDLTVEGKNNKLERALQLDIGKTDAKFNLKNVKLLKCTTYAFNICSDTTVYIDIKDSYIQGWGALNIWSSGYTVYAKNSTFEGINDKGYNADGWNDFGTIIVEGDTTGQTDMAASYNYLEFNNCVIKSSATTGNTQYHLLFNSPCDHNTMKLNKCEFISGQGNVQLFADDGEENTLIIDGVNYINA